MIIPAECVYVWKELNNCFQNTNANYIILCCTIFGEAKENKNAYESFTRYIELKFN